MTVIAFDTHTFYTKLKEAGFSEQQADILATIQKETASAAIEQAKHDFRLDDITTNKDLDARIKETELTIELVRKDIEVLRAELKRDIESVRKEIEQSKSELQRFMTSVVFGTAILQTAIVAGLILKLAGHF